MKGTARKITVRKAGQELEWRFGQEPEITVVDMSDPMDPVVRNVTSAELVEIAERVVKAAGEVLAKSPLNQTDLAYSVDNRKLSGGCWWTVGGGPCRQNFKAETLARIAELI